MKIKFLVLVTFFGCLGAFSASYGESIFVDCQDQLLAPLGQINSAQLRQELITAQGKKRSGFLEQTQLEWQAWTPLDNGVEVGFRMKSDGEPQAFARLENSSQAYKITDPKLKSSLYHFVIHNLHIEGPNFKSVEHSDPNHFIVKVKTNNIFENSPTGLFLMASANESTSLKALGITGSTDSETLKYLTDKTQKSRPDIVLTLPDPERIDKKIKALLPEGTGFNWVPFQNKSIHLKKHIGLIARGKLPLPMDSGFLTEYSKSFGSHIIPKNVKTKIQAVFQFYDELYFKLEKYNRKNLEKFEGPTEFIRPIHKQVFWRINNKLIPAKNSLDFFNTELSKSLSFTPMSKAILLEQYKIVLSLEALAPLFTLNPADIKKDLLNQFGLFGQVFFSNKRAQKDVLKIIEGIMAPDISYSKLDMDQLAADLTKNKQTLIAN